MFCRNCGKEITGRQDICMNCGSKPMAATSFCHGCGAPTTPLAEICVKCGVKLARDISPKSRVATTLFALPFCMPLGMFGAHRFYLGKIRTAVAMLLLTIVGFATCWFVVGIPLLIGVWIWALVDFIYAVSGNMKDKEGRLIKNW